MWLILTALVIDHAVSTSSTVRTVDELKRAVADPSIRDITLGGEVPFQFDSPWPVPGEGPSALLVNRLLTLRAATGKRVVLDAGASASERRRVLEVGAGGSVTLVGVEVTGGVSTTSGGGVRIGRGGALTLQDSVVQGNAVLANTTDAGGGGVMNNGHLTATGSRITGNNATSVEGTAAGGGINNGDALAVANLTESDVDSNAATSSAGLAGGGGVFNVGHLTAVRSRINGNSAASIYGHANGGGGIGNHGPTAVAFLSESYVDGNAAWSRTGAAAGGGAVNRAMLTAIRTHITGNSVTSIDGSAGGGGLENAGVAMLSESDVTNNTVKSTSRTASAGGVLNNGQLNLVRCRINGNNATSVDELADSGGLNNNGATAIAVLNASEVNRNTAASTTGVAIGGGVTNRGHLTAVRSRINGNSVASGKGDRRHIRALPTGGGGLRNHGVAVLNDSDIQGNAATSIANLVFGGGVFNTAHLTTARSLISGNSATSVNGIAAGGGINNNDGTAALSESNVEGNAAMSTTGNAFGGGVANFEYLTAVRSHIRGNAAISLHGDAQGGGLFNDGTDGAGSVLLVGALVTDSSAVGTNASGASILNGGHLSYVLPAPRGRWVPGVVVCRRVYCVGTSLCPIQPCDLISHPELEGEHLADVVAGPSEGNFPPACALGAFGDSIDANAQTGASCAGLCVERDPFSTTASEGAASADECVCVEGFYSGSSGKCTACQVGATNCIGAGATLATLNLTTNYWRLSNKTSDIQRCVGGGWEPGAPTPCSGGIVAGSYCAHSGLSGPRCRVCAQNAHGTPRRYYDEDTARCADCPATGAAALGVAAALGLACVVIVGLTSMLLGELRPTPGATGMVRGVQRVVAEARAIATYYQLVAKAKLLLGYYQVRAWPSSPAVSSVCVCARARDHAQHQARPCQASLRCTSSIRLRRSCS